MLWLLCLLFGHRWRVGYVTRDGEPLEFCDRCDAAAE